MSKSALDFLMKTIISVFRKLARFRQVHTVHYTCIHTVFHLPREKKKKRKTYKEQLFIYAEQVHNARTKIKTD